MHLKSDERVSIIANTGILTALIALVSAYVKVPVSNGYVHMGDGLIVFSAVILGPVAALPAAIGSILADIMAGFPQYILPTLIIKGFMGLFLGFVFSKTKQEGKMSRKNKIWRIIALIIAEFLMVMGYHVAGEILYGSAAAIGELIGNICQAVIGLIVGIIFMYVGSYFKKSKRED